MMLKRESGFTLIEILAVVAILFILVSVIVPGMVTSKIDSQRASEQATAKTLNEAVTRVILKETGGITSMTDWINTYGSNPTNAVLFLATNGFLRE
jgi:prepilin-type N-terminal cleavage/methylation domain-containing protein